MVREITGSRQREEHFILYMAKLPDNEFDSKLTVNRYVSKEHVFLSYVYIDRSAQAVEWNSGVHLQLPQGEHHLRSLHRRWLQSGPKGPTVL